MSLPSVSATAVAVEQRCPAGENSGSEETGLARLDSIRGGLAFPVFAAGSAVARISCSMMVAYHVELVPWEKVEKMIRIFLCECI